MALVPCHECGVTISSEASACIKCGAPIREKRWVEPDPPSPLPFSRMNTPPPEMTRRLWPWLAGVPVALFFAAGFFRDSSPEERERSQARDVIRLCWQDQERKSVAPDTQRLIARMCEDMEADFAQKYGTKP